LTGLLTPPAEMAQHRRQRAADRDRRSPAGGGSLGGTRVTFTFTLESAPRLERLVPPLLVPKLRRVNQTSFDRKATQL
jgi:hypothetical protein